MATEVLDREELINTIWANNGKLGLVAERLGVSVRTVYNYADKYATVQTAVESSRDHFDALLVDIAETGLRQALLDRRAWAIKYALDTKGKDRGYTKRQEITGRDGEPLEGPTVNVYIPENDRDGEEV